MIIIKLVFHIVYINKNLIYISYIKKSFLLEMRIYIMLIKMIYI